MLAEIGEGITDASGDSQVADAVYVEAGVDHGPLIGADSAGTTGQCGRGADLAGDAQSCNHDVEVTLVGVVRGIGRARRYRYSAGLGPRRGC